MMKNRIRSAGIAALAAAALAGSLVRAEENKNAQPTDAKQAEMMKKAQAAAAPGPAHKALEPLVGEWHADVKMWMSPDAPPNISKGTVKSAWTMKGRFVRQEFSGEFMGAPFTGLNFIGYDNVKEKYTSVWLDDMSTTMVVAEGVADKMGKVITLGGSYACAMTGEKEKPTKQVYRILGRDKHIFEMHDPRLGDKSKTMEIVYTRK